MAGRIIPSPKGIPLLGTLPYFLAAGGPSKLHEYVDKRHRQLGPIYQERIGPVTGIFVSSPKYMRHIFGAEGRAPKNSIPESWALYNQVYNRQRGLLFMKGDEWVNFRKIMNKVFLKPDSKILVPAVSVVADQLIKKLHRSTETQDIEQLLYAWSLESVLSILLGAESYKKQQNELQNIVKTLSGDLQNIFIESGTLTLLPASFAMKWNLPPWQRFVKAANNTFATASELMNHLESRAATQGGLLNLLVGSGIHSSDLRRITIDLILAAGDTTAYTTQWLLYNLGKHQDVQQKLYEEIKSLSDEETVGNPLMKGMIRETLRLYPVAPFLTRFLPNDIQLDGYEVKKDNLVILSLYSSGRDTLSFPDACDFRPERWIREARNYQGVTDPYGSLPFAMGARSCIGKNIAETLISVMIKKMLSTTAVEVEKEENVSIKLHLISVPSKPIVFKWRIR